MYKLFSSVHVTVGASRAIIFDVNEGNFEIIPKELGLIFESRVFEIENIDIEFLDFIDHLLKINYVHNFESRSFINQDLHFNSNCIIQDCIIDSSSFSTAQIEVIVDALAKFNIKFLEIRIFDKNNINLVDRWCELLAEGAIQSLDIWVRTSRYEHLVKLSELLKKYQFLNQIITGSNSKFNDVKQDQIIQLDIERISNENCGCRINDRMVINQDFFLQSLHYNNCLYKKLAIDSSGNLKNCLSLGKMYGNVFEADLDLIISSIEFNNIGLISKDKINVCKDCEFRHICSDCRANTSSIYDKPKSCNYDPYTATFHE